MQAFYQMPYERFEKWSPAGTAEQIAELLIPYAAAGCRTFNLIINGSSIESELDASAEIRDHPGGHPRLTVAGLGPRTR